MKFDTIIFDFDGVLVDSVDIKGNAFKGLYLDQNDDFQEQVYQHHLQNGGMPRLEKISLYEKWLAPDSQQAQLQDNISKSIDRFAETVENLVSEAKEIAGANFFLEKYQPKIPMHIVSATPEVELTRIISRRNMGQYFTNVFGTPKSKTDNINFIIEKHGYDRDKTLMVGDALVDFDAARKNRIHFVGRADDKENNLFNSTVTVIQDIFELDEVVA